MGRWARVLLWALGLLAAGRAGARGSFRSRGRFFDRDLASFSSAGELPQAEYARRAGQSGGSVVAAVTSDLKEVVLVVPTQSKTHVLQDRPSIHKVARVDESCHVAMSGLAGDARAAVQLLRKFSVKFKAEFGFPPSPAGLARAFADTQLEANVRGEKRPLGLQMLLIGHCPELGQMQMFEVDPSGDVTQRVGAAIGKLSGPLQTAMERRWGSVRDGDGTDALASLLCGLFPVVEDEAGDPPRMDVFIICQEGTVLQHRYQPPSD